MAEQAIILIPDISGFTDFTSITEIDHAAHIITELGYLTEIKVAWFVKARGVDMIVAHLLLKNDINSHEYILMTEACCETVGHGKPPSGPPVVEIYSRL